MDIKIFHKNDGGIIQLIDKEKMNEWPVELPLLFIEYIREKKLETYGDKKKEVENYLDEIMKEIAIPRLIGVLEGNDDEEILLAQAMCYYSSIVMRSYVDTYIHRKGSSVHPSPFYICYPQHTL